MILLKSELEGLERARQFMDVHFAEEVDVSKLCEISGLYQIKLYKAWKKKYNTTIYQYQLDRRMEKASELMNTELSAKAISLEIGYHGTSTRFWHLFKKRYGISPLEFRRNNSKGAYVII